MTKIEGGIPPINPTEKTSNNPHKEKSPEEKTRDVVELSEVAKLTLELQEAENNLRLLPNSKFLTSRIILLKSKIEELKSGQK